MNVFLTGPIQIGKSTAIKRFLEKHAVPVSGFRTVLNRETKTLTMTIHPPVKTGLKEITTLRVASKNPEGGPPVPDLREFDRAGRLLGEMDLKGCPLFLMDELGYMERNAMEFRTSVEQILRSDTPVIGALRNKPDGPFWKLLHELEDTLILVVDEDNRDQIPQIIAEYLGY